MAENVIVNSTDRLAEAVTKLTSMYKQNRYVKVSMSKGKDRTLEQNALWFAMYKRIAEMSEIGEIEDARSYCKLHVGVRILLRDSDEFRDAWNRLFLDWSYEDKLALMGPHPVVGPDGLPVTRLFERAQGIEYTNRIIDEFTQRGVVFNDLLGEAA